MSKHQAHDDHYLRQLLAQSPTSSELPNDEVYLRIWELEQGHTTTRWTNMTFFLSVSFAIFGFSFQAGLAPPLPSGARLIALGIYWFAYVLFRRFNRYTSLLRGYLHDLEQGGQTSLRIQTLALARLKKGQQRLVTSTRLLLYFGLLYTASVPILWWLTP